MIVQTTMLRDILILQKEIKKYGYEYNPKMDVFSHSSDTSIIFYEDVLDTYWWKSDVKFPFQCMDFDSLKGLINHLKKSK